MAAIYISSTYRDLIAYRKAVYQVLRQLGHDAMAMEDDVATDKRPAAKCLADVERADLYIGLFAWRYGDIPIDENPNNLAITEMEYRHAKDNGKACLIFLLADDAQWSLQLTDMFTGEGERGARITALRQELARDSIVSFFSTTEELAKLVSVAVQKWQEEQPLQVSVPGAQPGSAALSLVETAECQPYLRLLRRQCQTLPLAAMGSEVGTHVDLKLDDVYVDLNITPYPLESPQLDKEVEPAELSRLLQRDNREPPLKARDVALQEARLVLLGDPGAGKSTFVRQLITRLATFQLDPGQVAPEFPSEWRRLLPILITLRDLAPHLDRLTLGTLSEEKQQEALASVICAQAEAHASGYARGIQDALTTGACLLVLDGLDEVPHDQRPRIREAVDAVIRLYRVPRLIVTCRIRSYEGAAKLPDFAVHTLAPFDHGQIQSFIRAWYNTQITLHRIEAHPAELKTANLIAAIDSKALHELASNPMMLTTMAIVHQEQVGLPEERVRLYQLAVEVLLRRWQQSKTGDEGLTSDPALSALLRDDQRLRPVVEALADAAHRSRGGHETVSDLPRGEALTLLEQSPHVGRLDLAAAFLDYVDQRAGLLVGRGGGPSQPVSYSFPHRTFQEYLAGCHLVNQRDVGRTFFEHAAEGDRWALAAELGAEELLYNRRGHNALLDLMYYLCPSVEPNTPQAQRAVLWSGMMAALVGCEAIARDVGSPEGGKTYLKRLRPRLVQLLRSDLPAVERADAGNALARLGDPRFRADAWYLPDEPQLGFVEISEGDFLMGSDPKRDAAAFGDEEPQHRVFLSTYWIDRYPVTVAQFRAFVKVSGYDWAGQEDRQGEANHPVVHVSWDDAQAYCQWLTEQLRGWAETPEPLATFLRAGGWLTLPSEAQWEKASRGPDGGLYPWGDKAESNRANYNETGIRRTSPVGCFPTGISPYQVEEMSGNVLEWVEDWYDESYYSESPERDPQGPNTGAVRVIRGGSWSFPARYARSARRPRIHPDFRLDNLGFRCLSSGREPGSGAPGKP